MSVKPLLITLVSSSLLVATLHAGAVSVEEGVDVEGAGTASTTIKGAVEKAATAVKKAIGLAPATGVEAGVKADTGEAAGEMPVTQPAPAAKAVEAMEGAAATAVQQAAPAAEQPAPAAKAAEAVEGAAATAAQQAAPAAGSVQAAPDSAAAEAAQSEAAQADMEQKIRAYRELYDSRQIEQQKRREEARQRHEARKQAYEARHKAYAEKVDAHLKQQEERYSKTASEQETIRSRTQEDRDYLAKHHQELLEMALKRKDDLIKRHEEMRQQADARRAEIAERRAKLRAMGPDEWRAYMDEHYDEIFQRNEEGKRPLGPRPPWSTAPVPAPEAGGNQPPPVQ
jgi:hypothetical protein